MISVQGALVPESMYSSLRLGHEHGVVLPDLHDRSSYYGRTEVFPVTTRLVISRPLVSWSRILLLRIVAAHPPLD